MTPEERTEQIAEARLFAIAAPLILPLIERRRKVASERLMADFKEGRTDHTARVAELTVLFDLEREIVTKEEYYRTLEEQSHADRRK